MSSIVICSISERRAPVSVSKSISRERLAFTNTEDFSLRTVSLSRAICSTVIGFLLFFREGGPNE
ncbi:hypothetical protein D3C75_1315540 [compost metagenome]